MDEHKDELIGYLRVVWWGKWIILVSLVLAVGIAGTAIWTSPASHSQSGSFEVQETLSLYTPSEYLETLAQFAVQSLPLLRTAGLQRVVSQKNPHLLDVTVSGAASAQEVESAFNSSLSALEAGLVTRVGLALVRERASAATEVEQLTRQVALLRQRKGQEADQAILGALGESIAALEMARVEASVRCDRLGALLAEGLVSLREIGRSPVAEMGRSLTLTLAVAGFTGLFLGTLLAFFAHYLIFTARGDANGMRGA